MFPITTILSPVSAILVMIDRIHRNELNAVTIVFVAFAIGGLLPPVLYAVLWDAALRDDAYKAWLATFDEDWDTNRKYETWWWIFELEKKLMHMGTAVKQLISCKEMVREGSDA